MVRVIVAVSVLVAFADAARAEPAGRDAASTTERAPVAPRAATLTEQIEDRLTELGQAMDQHVGRLSLDRVSFRVDGRRRLARFAVGRGDGGFLSLRIGGDVKFEHGLAHVDAAIDLSLDGHQVHIPLPRFDVVPTSYNGEHYLEVRLPILRGEFEPERWFR